jgi:hypothetical protein
MLILHFHYMPHYVVCMYTSNFVETGTRCYRGAREEDANRRTETISSRDAWARDCFADQRKETGPRILFIIINPGHQNSLHEGIL